MLISIAGPKTRNEYKNLIKTQREVNINNTSKKLDEYVYDKTGGVKTLGLISLLGFCDYLFYNMSNHEKMFSQNLRKNKIITLAGMAFYNLMAAYLLYEGEEIKQVKLSNPKTKLEIYRKSGINAVV